MKFVYAALPLSLALLTGCAARVNNDVTTFHTDVMPSGETIRVVPSDPNKIGSLEFRTYAERIGEELRKVGYTPVTDTDIATDLLAEVDYDVEIGPTEVHSEPSMSRVRYHFGFGRYYNPWYFGVGGPFDPFWDQPDVYSTQMYQRTLEVNIVNNDGGELERVFEGRVESNGTESALPEVMPYLITAMFTNFPGESGMTKLVTIEKDM